MKKRYSGNERISYLAQVVLEVAAGSAAGPAGCGQVPGNPRIQMQPGQGSEPGIKSEASEAGKTIGQKPGVLPGNDTDHLLLVRTFLQQVVGEEFESAHLIQVRDGSHRHVHVKCKMRIGRDLPDNCRHSVLIDTSIWIDHFRNSNEELKKLLMSGQVCSHPFVIGELSCSNISNRTEILTLLRALPEIDTVLDEEVFVLIEDKKLYRKGLGFIDVHLLASALIHHVIIWTTDKHLHIEGLWNDAK